MTDWHKKQEVTNKIGMKTIIALYKLFGYTIARLALYPVAAYYFLTKRTARSASLQYLNQLALSSESIKPGLLLVYKHFVSFAESILDQFLIWINQPLSNTVHYQNETDILELIENRRGFVLLSAHLGNLVVCQYLSTLRPKLKINIIVHLEHAVQFNRLLDAYRSHDNISFYQANDISPATAGELFEKSKSGEVVVMAADRIPVSKNNRVEKIRFLDKPAEFPQGPFILAGLLDCPVYTLFCLKQDGQYCMYFDFLAEKIDMQPTHRAEEISLVMKKFSHLLEKYCRIAPLQWFNFYHFWQ